MTTSRNILSRGFSLIELMIVVAIVAILASVAYPAYQDHMRKTRRADAQTGLLELAQFLERFYTTNGRYTNADGTRPALPFTASPKDGGGVYTLQFNETGIAAAERPGRYVLEAVPIAAGVMNNDPCGTLRLSSTGAKTRTGALAADLCWRR